MLSMATTPKEVNLRGRRIESVVDRLIDHNGEKSKKKEDRVKHSIGILNLENQEETQEIESINLVSPTSDEKNSMQQQFFSVDKNSSSSLSLDNDCLVASAVNEHVTKIVGEKVPEFIFCTTCDKKLNIKKHKINKHPLLAVVVCKNCLKFVNSTKFTCDEMGVEEQCTWCGDGGNLVCCDYCEKAYCKYCIKRNLGKDFLKAITNTGESVKWKCLICDNMQIDTFVRDCSLVMNFIADMQNKKDNTITSENLPRTNSFEYHNSLSESAVEKKCLIENSLSKQKESNSDLKDDHQRDTQNEINLTHYSNKKIDSKIEVEQKNKRSHQKSLFINDNEVGPSLEENFNECHSMKKKKQTIIVLSSDEDLDDSDDSEIVVLNKSGKCKTISRSMLNVVKALVKKSLQQKETYLEQKESSNFINCKNKKPKKTLDSFLRLKLDGKKKAELAEKVVESENQSNLSDQEEIDGNMVVDQNDTLHYDNLSLKNQAKSHFAKSNISKNVENSFCEKNVKQVEKVVVDDQQPGPSGVRPRNKMQKMRESALKHRANLKVSDCAGKSERLLNKSHKISSNYLSDTELDKTIVSDDTNKLNGICKFSLENKNCDNDVNYMTKPEKNSFVTIQKRKSLDQDNFSLIKLDSPIMASVDLLKISSNNEHCKSSKSKFSNQTDIKSEHLKMLEAKVVVEKLPSSPIKTNELNNFAESSDTKELHNTTNHPKEIQELKSTWNKNLLSDQSECLEAGQPLRKLRLRKVKSANLVKTAYGSEIGLSENGSKQKKNFFQLEKRTKKISETNEIKQTSVNISDVSDESCFEDHISGEEGIVSSIEDTDWSEENNLNKSTSSKCKRKIVSSDSDNKKFSGRRSLKKRRKVCVGISDEESDFSQQKSSTSSSEDEKVIKSKKNIEKSLKRRKPENSPKNVSLSDTDSEVKTSSKGRKKIRKILKDNELNEETIHAREVEEERKRRLLERINAEKKSYEHIVNAEDGEFVLERNSDQQALVSVNININKHLKPHQRKGVQFMYDCCIESVKNFKKGDEGGGCLLAHCMGLGKTLQVVSFIHTLVNSKNIEMRTFIVIAPLNTVLNWEQEFQKWLSDDEEINIYVLSYAKDNKEKVSMIRDWYKNGGVLIMGYEMYRNLANGTHIRSKKNRDEVKKYLVDPGPQMVICDEGHVLRNVTSAISKALNSIATKRRIVLTGTPLQNNLPEYHCMVDFVKPKLLGTKKEFLNRFVNPIKNGQCSNSTPYDVRIMKQRCHVLYQMLSGCVQRQDYSVLTPFLPPKREYTIFVRLHEKQIKMYKYYLENFVNSDGQSKIKGVSLFSDFQCLSKIWTHPWALHIERERQRLRDINKEDDSIEEFLDDSDNSAEESEISLVEEKKKKPWSVDTSSDEDVKIKKRNKKRVTVINENSYSSDNSSNEEVIPTQGTYSRRTRSAVSLKTFSDKEIEVKSFDKPIEKQTLQSGTSEQSEDYVQNEEESGFEKDWYDEFLAPEDQHNIELSGKLVLLCEILADAEVVGDKVLVFSQSLCTLNLIESTLSNSQKDDSDCLKWCHGVDYFRMDGSTPVQKRKRWAEIFNDPENVQCRLFLISTRAGSLGINMVGANRVIIFDCSWNPSHDVQSVFRVYRFGQEKPVYVYRFIAQGTMEEKIYGRQITKLATAGRVVDEQQIERHFSEEEIRELYSFAPEQIKGDDETPQLPKDPLLAEVVQRQHPKHIVRYHEHDVLLENIESEELNEEERKQAWKEYEKEKESAVNHLTYRQHTVTYATENPVSHFQNLLLQQQRQVQNRMQFNETINNSQQNRIYTKIPPGISPSAYSHLQYHSRMEQYSRDSQMASLGYMHSRFPFNQQSFNLGIGNRSLIPTPNGRYMEVHTPSFHRDISINNPFSREHRMRHPSDRRPLNTNNSSAIGPSPSRAIFFPRP